LKEFAHDLAQRVRELTVAKSTAIGERRLRRGYGQRSLDHVGADRLQDFAELGLRPDRAEQPCAGPYDGDRLAAQAVVGKRAR